MNFNCKCVCVWGGRTYTRRGTYMQDAMVICRYWSLYFTGTPLTLKTVFNALHSVSHKWFCIGLQLDVPVYHLNSIEANQHNTQQQMCSMLEYWMNNATDPLPSWRVLVDALKAAAVSENRLSQDLEERYCSPEDQNSLGGWEPKKLINFYKTDVFRRVVVIFSGSTCCDNGNTGNFMCICVMLLWRSYLCVDQLFDIIICSSINFESICPPIHYEWVDKYFQKSLWV